MFKSFIRKISLVFAGTVLVLIPAAPVFAESAQPLPSQLPSSRPMFFLRRQSSIGAALTNSTSENWSGYAATASSNAFTSVSSSWVVPTLSCASTKASYSAFWVGLDGYNDQTVEQIGTEANCVNGQSQYYTWYEMYPQNPSEVLVPVNLAAGNTISSSVTYNPPTITKGFRGRNSVSPGSFTLSLTDNTTGRSYSTTQTVRGVAERSSAEVIAEAPYSYGILPLADFVTANYSNSKVNGNSLGSAPGLQAITMDDPSGMVATPSVLDTTGENFSVSWSDPS